MAATRSESAETALRAFVRASGLFRNRMDPYFAQHGISAAQWGVLRALQRAEAEGLEGLQLNKLSQRLLVRPPSVTSILDRLERVGLVARQPIPTDQRAKQVALTAAGRALVARVLRAHPAQIHGIMTCLSPPEQRKLQCLMDRLAAHLESLSPAAPHPETPESQEIPRHEPARHASPTRRKLPPLARRQA